MTKQDFSSVRKHQSLQNESEQMITYHGALGEHCLLLCVALLSKEIVDEWVTGIIRDVAFVSVRLFHFRGRCHSLASNLPLLCWLQQNLGKVRHVLWNIPRGLWVDLKKSFSLMDFFFKAVLHKTGTQYTNGSDEELVCWLQMRACFWTPLVSTSCLTVCAS